MRKNTHLSDEPKIMLMQKITNFGLKQLKRMLSFTLKDKNYYIIEYTKIKLEICTMTYKMKPA